MGVDLGDLFEKKEVEIEELSGRVIAIDAFNAIYQFLSTIRQQDGTPLKNSRGEITSHLSGILYRTTNLVENGVKPVYVFDGEPPVFKRKTVNERVRMREEMEEKWLLALEEGRMEDALKYARASSRLRPEMVESSKKLLRYLGIPFVEAPSEGEAQAAYMARKGDVDAVGSQDYDSLLFGAPLLVRNLTITGKRKLPGKNIYVEISPELIYLEENLKRLGITREQLIDIALLVGTDYNEGVKGVGPKRALSMVREGADVSKLIRDVEYEEIREFFMNPPHTDEYELRWREPDEEGVLKFLCDEHDFSEERVRRALERIKSSSLSSQSTLDRWF
ncbi:MAG: flap endonuclease [Archaeoglobi archaeon]|nr:flap endonuclease-1 [Candidatus Mnemosynella bozhongmuii]MDI3502401.1 flap endonuclease [Archaeoglobi archaeon]MDK2782269.1 flap endonuclease [Archaeoglobi archaeon]